MAEAVAKKRQRQPGFKRVVVNLTEEQYTKLAEVAKAQMREPNNLLSFILSTSFNGLLSEHQ